MSLTHAEIGRLQKKVAKYAWQVRDEMWLGLWSVNVLLTEYPGAGEDALASIIPTSGQHKAELEIRISTANQGGEVLRRTVVHEMLHLYHRDSSDIFRLGLKEELGGSAYRMLWEAYRQQIELMVDDIAHAWESALPLPDWSNDS